MPKTRIQIKDLLRYTLVSGLLICLFTPSISHGQEEGIYKRNLSRADSQAIAAASAIADTGRMMLGFQDLSTLKTPGACLAISKMMHMAVWRSKERDTMQYGAADSIPTAVREIALRCGGNMRPDNVDEMDLSDLLELNAIIGDTARILQVVNYYEDLEHIDLTRKFRFMHDAVRAAGVFRTPARIEFARSILRRLQSYGEASIAQVGSVWDGIHSDATRRFDTAAVLESWAQRTEYFSGFTEEQQKAATPDRRIIFTPRNQYEERTAIALYKRPEQLDDTLKMYADSASGGNHALLFDISRYIGVVTSRIGKPPSEMELVGAFPAGASATPQQGKVTLYYRIQEGDIMGVHMRPRYAILQRLHQKYHEQGLKIVIVTAVQGYMWGSAPLEPEKEAELHAWYFRNYLKLPFTVLANRQNLIRLEDGRIRRMPLLFDRYYDEDGKYVGRNMGYLVGRDGTYQTSNTILLMSEATAEAFILAEINKPYKPKM